MNNAATYIQLFNEKIEKIDVIRRFYKSRRDHITLILSQTTKQKVVYENRIKLTYTESRIRWCQDMMHDAHEFMEWESKQLAYEAFLEKYPNCPE